MCSKYKVLTLESYITDDAIKINVHIYAIFTTYSKNMVLYVLKVYKVKCVLVMNAKIENQQN